MKKIKLLYCIPNLCNSGGMEKILTQKVNWLVENGYDVDILTTEQEGKKPFFYLSEKINLIDLPINFNHSFNNNLLKKFYIHYRKLYEYKRVLGDLCKKNNYDIIISLGGKEIEFLSKLRIQSKKIAELHFSQNFKEQFLSSLHTNPIYKLIGRYQTHNLKTATKGLDKLVVLTKEDQQQWEKTHNNIIQIYNFNDPPITSTPVTFTKQKRFIAVGRLDEQKGFDLLIPAWVRVKERYPDWKLDIYGTGKWENKLQKEIVRLELDDVITLKGQSSHIFEEMKKSSAFVLSSRYEGFPMVLLEACQAGLSIVAFDCKTGPKEIVHNNVNGYLITPESIEDLSHGIISLISDNEKREKFERASINIGEKFKKEKIMKEWDNLFKSLINAKND